MIGEDKLPVVRLHELRQTHATILLTAREPVHVVSARLGHASATITMQVYAHVLPGSQREAAELFAALIERGKAQRGAPKHQSDITGVSRPGGVASHLGGCRVRGGLEPLAYLLGDSPDPWLSV